MRKDARDSMNCIGTFQGLGKISVKKHIFQTISFLVIPAEHFYCVAFHTFSLNLSKFLNLVFCFIMKNIMSSMPYLFFKNFKNQNL